MSHAAGYEPVGKENEETCRVDIPCRPIRRKARSRMADEDIRQRKDSVTLSNEQTGAVCDELKC